MKSILRPSSISGIAAALAGAVLFASCSSTDTGTGTEITNSKYFLLDPETQLQTPDPMMTFEYRRYMHGAITREERKEREGHYYVFWWEDRARTPAVVRFEYRQENTGSQVLVQEVAVDSVRRKNKTRFQVTGEEYALGGKVTSWRASVLRDGMVVASDQSYLW